MAAAAAAIVVTDYESLNAKIIDVVGDGSDLLLAGTIGRKLSLAGAVEESEFARSGTMSRPRSVQLDLTPEA